MQVLPIKKYVDSSYVCQSNRTGLKVFLRFSLNAVADL